MTLCLMIKKKFLAEKLVEQQRTGSFIERRAYTKYWRSRIGSASVWSKLRNPEAIFLCGRYAFYAGILRIDMGRTTPVNDDVIITDVCYNIECRFSPDERKDIETYLALGQRDDEQ